MRDTRTWLLVLLSICIVATWVYHLYDKQEYNKHPRIVYETIPQPVGNRADTNRVQLAQETDTGVNGRLEGIVTLRNEIASMLRDSNITSRDLFAAEEKIRTLQQEIINLHRQTDSLINQKGRDSVEHASANQITAVLPNPVAPRKSTDTDAKPGFDNSSTFKVSQINLKAVNANDESTMEVADAINLFASFQLTNNNTSFNNTPIYVALIDPQGNCIQDDLWEAGIISVRNDGQVKYTRKINVEYARSDTKKINLSIQLPRSNSGRYRLLVYHNGNRIGRSDINLR